VNPKEILDSHLDKTLLTKEQLEDVEDMFDRALSIGLRAAKGEDVDADLVHIQAQIALFKSGTVSATQDALHNAATQWAQEAGRYLGVVVKAAIGGLAL
jgi:hypothetical protein